MPHLFKKDRLYLRISLPFRWGILILGIFLLHYAKVARVLPLDFLISSEPLLQGEHFLDVVESTRFNNFVEKSGKTGGYDPFTSAGSLVYPLLDSDRRLIILLAHSLSQWWQPAQTTKWVVFFIYLFCPVFIFLAVRYVTDKPSVRVLATALSVAGFLNFDFLSEPLVREGHAVFIFSNYLTVFVLCLFVKGFGDGRIKDFVFFGLSCAVLLLSQGFLFSLTLAVMIIFLTIKRDELKARRVIPLAFGLLFAIGVNWFWCFPAIEFRNYFEPYFSKLSNIPLQEIVTGFLPLPVKGFFFENLVRSFLLISAFLALRTKGKNIKKYTYPLVCWMSVLSLTAILGQDVLGIEKYRPGRFLFSLAIGSIIPASLVLETWLFSRVKVQSFIAIWFLWFQMTWQPASSYWEFPSLWGGFKPAEKQLIHWFKQKPQKGRILIEDSHKYYILNRFLPVVTSQSIIGPVMPYNQSKVMTPLDFFGNSVDSKSGHGLTRYINQYNIQVALVVSMEAKRHFQKEVQGWDPLSVVKTTAYPIWIYILKTQPSNYFLKGSGKLTMDYNHLEIKNPSAGDIILRLHWFPVLGTSSQVEVGPYHVEGFPLPFIQIKNKGERELIRIQHN